MVKKLIIVALIFFAAVVILITAAVLFIRINQVEIKNPAWQNSESITISEGTQGNIEGNIRIGVGNIRKSDYVDDNGINKHNLVVGLWINFPDDSSKNQTITAYAGKTINAGKYSLYIEKIEAGFLGHGSVLIRFKGDKETRLEDPELLYASFFSSGLCQNDKGEDGGCYSNDYLYRSGKFIGESGWQGIAKVDVRPTVEKQFSQEVMDRIIKQIRDSGIMAMSCPSQLIMDAWWTYQINIDGAKKTFETSPPENCQAELNKIDELISNAVNAEEANVVDYINTELIYSSDNGSLPPEYYRKAVFTLLPTINDTVNGELVISDYEIVLEKSNVSITLDEFKKLVDDGLALKSEEDSSAGCTGGTNQSVKIIQSGKTLLETANYNCAGKSTNESLKEFSQEIDKIMQKLSQ